MTTSSPNAEPVLFKGSMKVGYFNAQLFVDMAVTPPTLLLRASLKSFRIDRENVLGMDELWLFGFIWRGIRIRHCQPGLATKVIFRPSMNRETFWSRFGELGWSWGPNGHPVSEPEMNRTP